MVEQDFSVNFQENPNQRFVIENDNADITTLIVSINETPSINSSSYSVYSLAENVVEIGSSDNVYWIQENESGKYELFFGNGRIGKKLVHGSAIKIQYLTTSGAVGNNISSGYNFSDVILFLDKPMITSMDFPKFNISSNKLKASISNRPFSGRFKLITEQEDWQVSDDRNLKRIEAKKVIFALKDADEMNLDFYFQASNLGFSFLHKIQGKGPEKQNSLILKGAIFNSGMGGLEERYQPIKRRTIMLEQLNVDLGFFELHCNDLVAVNLLKFTTEDDVDCLLKLSSKEISKIKTDDVSIQRIINFVKLLLIINNTTKPAEPQPIPIKLSLNKGLLYINAIPIYQFPTQY